MKVGLFQLQGIEGTEGGGRGSPGKHWALLPITPSIPQPLPHHCPLHLGGGGGTPEPELCNGSWRGEEGQQQALWMEWL